MIEIMGFIATLFALALIVFFHEMGHFLAAKRVGVFVYEFAVGFGPKAFSFIKNKTRYSLRILPLGGYVKLAGMDEPGEGEEEVAEDQKYPSKSAVDRMFIIVAGSIMNVIFGFMIYLLIAFFVGVASSSAIIEQVLKDSPASQAGLQAKDVLVSINKKTIKSVDRDVIPIIKESAGRSLSIGILRDGKALDFVVVPRSNKEQLGQIGVRFSVSQSLENRFNPIASLSDAGKNTMFSVVQVFKTFEMLFQKKASVSDLAGPVGIFQVASEQFSKNLIAFLLLMAFISISLGIINLFPFPILDGGHLFFLIIETIFGKPVPKKVETIFNYAGFVALILLSIFVLFNDVINWQERSDLIRRMLSK